MTFRADFSAFGDIAVRFSLRDLSNHDKALLTQTLLRELLAREPTLDSPGSKALEAVWELVNANWWPTPLTSQE